uniref:ADP-ribosylation factor-like protein 11 n=1 Tax=Geotrypetes seraphini TaxID=260995 RepID=A0A6P8R1K0_GEOSA|nr:ADP-ribosylation factor-like protein 11 isoform X2 [Geotrypetes seraphini]
MSTPSYPSSRSLPPLCTGARRCDQQSSRCRVSYPAPDDVTSRLRQSAEKGPKIGVTSTDFTMGALASKPLQKQARVVMMGLDFAGKSTLLYKLKRNQAVQTLPTVGFNVESVELEKSVPLTIWDVGGQDKLRTNWNDYLEDTDALIFVVDSTDRARLKVAGSELRRLLDHAALDEVPFLILANKQDAPDAMGVQELGQHLGLNRYSDRSWEMRGCSALTGEGLLEALHTIGRLLKKHRKP